MNNELSQLFQDVCKKLDANSGLYAIIFSDTPNRKHIPAEYVKNILISLYQYDEDKARGMVMEIHTAGLGIIGLYPKEDAEQLFRKTVEMAEADYIPLGIDMVSSNKVGTLGICPAFWPESIIGRNNNI